MKTYSWGCIALLALALIFWLAFMWWLTGVLLDWANVRFALGLVGTAHFVSHLAIFFVLNALASLGGNRPSK